MNQPGKPMISVCIPVYNGADFIAIAIDSVLTQSFTDFELIIIDNCSTDDTLGVIKKYDDKRIKLILNDSNIGLVPNWNKALQLATGKYIKILPADDFLYPDCLMMQCNVLENDSDKKISLVCGRRNIIDHKGKTLFSRGFTTKAVQINGFAAINKLISSGGNIIGEGGAVLFRREVIGVAGVFSDAIFYVLDLDLWLRILVFGDLYALPAVVSAFRVSPGSASVTVAKQQRKDFFDFINKIYNDKKFQLSWANYKVGLAKSFLIAKARNILYKYIL